MRPESPARWQVLAFLYAGVVPFGLLFGSIYLARRLGTSLPGGEVVWMLAWVIVVLAGGAVLGARASVGVARLLPALVGGVAASFGGVQLVVWRSQSLIAMLFGTFAIALVVAGNAIGAAYSGYEARDERVIGELVRAGGVLVALAFAAAVVDGTGYWLQDVPVVHSWASRALMAGSLVVGFAAVWRWELRLRVFLPLVAALPFVAMVADALTDPIALVFDLPAGGPLSFDATAIGLSATVAALVGIGAVLAAGIRHLNSEERTGASIGPE